MPGFTPNLSIPYPVAADNISAYPALAKQQAEALEALATQQAEALEALATQQAEALEALATQQAEALEALHYDSGWVDCPYRPGFTSATVGKLQARRIGLVVYLRGVAYGSFPVNIYTPVANIPAAILPPPAEVYAASFGTAGKSCGIYITTAGEIQLVHAITPVPNWISAQCNYVLT